METDLRLGAMLQGQLGPQEAVAQGVVKLDGNRSLLRAFAKVFRLPGPVPAAG